jgi:chromosome segregation protein
MLLDKISSPWPLDALLAGVYIAADRQEAERLRRVLGPHESVITPDGVWVGPNWAQVPGAGGQESGILERERLLNELGEQVSALERTVARLQADHEASRRVLQTLESREYALGQDLQSATDDVAQAKTLLSRHEGELEWNAERAAAIEAELADLRYLSEENVSAIETAKATLARMKRELAEFDDEGARLAAARQEIQAQLLAARAAWRDAREASHDVALRLESMRSNRQSLATAIERNRQLKDQLAAGCAVL